MVSEQSSKRQARLAYAVSEAHHEENLAMLRRIPGISSKARDLLVWIANIEHRTDNPLRRTYEELGEPERGLRCHRNTARRIACQLLDIGVISVTTILTSSGQKPNEYRIDWDGVREALGIKPEHHFGTARAPKWSSPSTILVQPEHQNGAHIKEIHSSSSLLRTLPPSATEEKPEEPTTAVLEISNVRETREQWIEEAYRKGVQKAEEAIDIAIRDGRDVPGILKHFNSVMMGWDWGKAGWILFLRLTKSPPGIAADEAWPEYQHPRAVEISLEKQKRLEAASKPPPPPTKPVEDPVKLQLEQTIAQITQRLREMTPEARVEELLRVKPNASDFDKQIAIKNPGPLALLISKQGGKS